MVANLGTAIIDEFGLVVAWGLVGAWFFIAQAAYVMKTGFAWPFFSPTAAQMGAFNWSYTVTGNVVNFTVTNPASLHSLLYHIPFVPSYERSTFRPGGTIHQTFNWSEPSPCGP